MRCMLLLVLAAIGGAALAQGSGLKPGLWEVKMIQQTRDGKDMTAQMAAARSQMEQAMARMPPEQRQRMEAVMGGQGANAAGQRICISAAMAARDKPLIDPQSGCEPSTLTHSSSTKLAFEFSCTANGVATTGTGESMIAGDTITMLVDKTVTDSHGRHTMHSETQMKYVGQDCQGITPLDQRGREFKGPAGAK